MPMMVPTFVAVSSSTGSRLWRASGTISNADEQRRTPAPLSLVKDQITKRDIAKEVRQIHWYSVSMSSRNRAISTHVLSQGGGGGADIATERHTAASSCPVAMIWKRRSVRQ